MWTNPLAFLDNWVGANRNLVVAGLLIGFAISCAVRLIEEVWFPSGKVVPPEHMPAWRRRSRQL